MKNGTGRRGRILLCADGSETGRALLGELLERTRAEIVLAGTNEARMEAWHATLEPEHAARVTPFALDPRDGRAVQTAIDRVQLAVCAVAPFRAAPPTIARAALCSGVDYVDLAGRRESAEHVRALALELFPENDGPAVAGAFALTALAGALATLAVRDLDEVDVLRIALVPGPGFPASRRERANLLAFASRPFRLVRQGVWCTVRGWSEPGEFRFRAPLGTRTGRLVDAPDCQLFPSLFGAQRVELRLDAQGLSGSGVEALARLRGSGLPFLGGARWLAGVLSLGGSLLAGAPEPAAAVGVEAEGRYGRHPLQVRCALSDPRGLAHLAVLPAAHLIERLLGPRSERDSALRGRIPYDRWIDPLDLMAECTRLGLELAIDEQ